MKRNEFLALLAERLVGLPGEDRARSLDYYAEMIDDRIEDGMTEEEATRAVGTPETAAEAILAEIPLSRLVKERVRPARSLTVLEIVLLVLGSPVWLSLAVAAFAVLVSLYAVIWSCIVCLWAAFSALAVSAVCGVLASPFLAINVGFGAFALLLGAGVLSAGLAILAFYGCLAATRGLGRLTKKLFLFIKFCLIRKEKDA